MYLLNTGLDIYNSIICFMLAAYLFMNKGLSNRQSRWFFYLCIFNAVMSLGDIADWCCNGFERPWYPFALGLGTFVYYLCAVPILITFLGFMISYLSPKVQVRRCYWNISVALCVIYTICCVVSLFNGMFYYIDENNIYQRGDWFFLSQTIPFVLYGLNTFIIFKYRSYMRRKDGIVLFSYIAFPIIAEVIQIMNYGIALLNVGITLSILLIFINIQVERELIFERKERELAQTRIDTMLSQIQPHFLYNVLTGIRKLCETDPSRAVESISIFSKFLRANMESLTDKHPIPFEKELSHTQAYLQLEQQRFGDKLKVVYEIEAVDFSVPPLTVQPIAENAVRHGIMKKENGGTLTIRTGEDMKNFFITVTDDGIGFSTEQLNEKNGVHIGISNVRSRLQTLCGGTVTIQSEPVKGTTVRICIPKEERKL